MSYEIVTALLLLLLALLTGAFLGCLFRRWSQPSPSEAERGKPEQTVGLAAASLSRDTTSSNLAQAPVAASSPLDDSDDETRKDEAPQALSSPQAGQRDELQRTNGVGKKPSQAKSKSKSKEKAAAPAKSAVKKPPQARGLKAAIGGKADDLKTISGVGPKLEKTLNGLGIFHFEQIAGWGAKDVSEVDDLLSFKGRIERDKWIAQAKKLAKK